MENFTEVLARLVGEPMKAFVDNFIRYLPNLMAALFVFVTGIITAGLLKVVVGYVLRLVRFDRYAERSGMKNILSHFCSRQPLSLILAKIAGVFWVVLLSIIAISCLQIPATNVLLENTLLFLPNVLMAFLIVVIGYFSGKYVEQAALISAVNASIKPAQLLSRGAWLGVMMLTVSLAMEQLGIGKGTIAISFNIILAGVVFAFALAFGLGGKEHAREYLEKKVSGNEWVDKSDIDHI